MFVHFANEKSLSLPRFLSTLLDFIPIFRLFNGISIARIWNLVFEEKSVEYTQKNTTKLRCGIQFEEI